MACDLDEVGPQLACSTKMDIFYLEEAYHSTFVNRAKIKYMHGSGTSPPTKWPHPKHFIDKI